MLDRRRFLQAAAAAAPGAAAAAAGQFTGKIKKAVKFHMIAGEQSELDKLKLLKDLGYDGVEAHTRDVGKTYDPARLAKASEQTGVPVHGVINSSNPDIKSAIDLARQLGGDSVLVVAGRVGPQVPYDENYRQTQQIIRSQLPYAQQHGVKILVENVWNNFLLSPLEMARYLDELESDHVGAYFDVGNVVRFGWPDQWIRILGKRIGKLDIKEYSRDKQLNEGLRKGFQVEIGDGDCGWESVRRELAAIEYAGWATAEVPGGDRQRLAEIAERMDRVLDL
jgi:hexulose-6-phosphate isomerase